MTRIKLCGLRRREDILTANALLPEYIGFVFAQKSRRYVTPEQAAELKRPLDGRIKAVGVFVDETPEAVARLLKAGIIDLAQLHGYEDEAYLWYNNEHCVALIGYDMDEGTVTLCDPLSGIVDCDAEEFRYIYDMIGQMSMTVIKEKIP
jgi:phosphoribosylanthranilate isomerase